MILPATRFSATTWTNPSRLGRPAAARPSDTEPGVHRPQRREPRVFAFQENAPRLASLPPGRLGPRPPAALAPGPRPAQAPGRPAQAPYLRPPGRPVPESARNPPVTRTPIHPCPRSARPVPGSTTPCARIHHPVPRIHHPVPRIHRPPCPGFAPGSRIRPRIVLRGVAVVPDVACDVVSRDSGKADVQPDQWNIEPVGTGSMEHRTAIAGSGRTGRTRPLTERAGPPAGRAWKPAE